MLIFKIRILYIPFIGIASHWMSLESNFRITLPILQQSQLCDIFALQRHYSQSAYTDEWSNYFLFHPVNPFSILLLDDYHNINTILITANIYDPLLSGHGHIWRDYLVAH